MKKLLSIALMTGLASTALMASVEFGACKGCHGQGWEKPALGKSKIVKDMTSEDIATALKGYKDGTYGGPMKGVMKGQVVRHSNEDLEEAAKLISAQTQGE